ncbi:Mfs1.2 [Cyathus striatus]|nr:Mfs1.2 [Cyathus striatus]
MGNETLDETPSQTAPKIEKKDLRFWMIMIVLNVSFFLAVLETSIISTPLPTIIHELNGNAYVWVGSAYNIAATAFMPITGGLSEAFGRRPVYIASLVLLAIGSLVCGVSPNNATLIAGRAIQGAGGSGILSGTSIILSDIVSLKERGLFFASIQMSWCVAAGIGPLIGGALAQIGAWRWIFFLNLPIAGVTITLSFLFLRLKSPTGTFSEHLQKIDFIGNGIIIGSAVSIMIAITWADNPFSWASAQVLVPLVIGACGMVVFVVYELKWCRNPIIPGRDIVNRTCLSGFLQISFMPMPFFALVYYLPLYFQACKDMSPLRSGVNLLPLAFTVAPMAVLTGVTISRTGRYRPQTWMGWVIIVICFALFTTLSPTSSIHLAWVYEIIAGLGFGIIHSTVYFPVLASLPVTSTAHALAFFSFLRQFSQTWGITIGGVIVQSVVSSRLSPAIKGALPQGSILDNLSSLQELPQAELTQVQNALGCSLMIAWGIFAGISGLGLLSSVLMRGISLRTSVDEKWGIERNKELSS